MAIKTALFQFEIRFKPILNFYDSIPSVIAPFLAISTNINITDERTKNSRFIIDYSESKNKIIIGWDRIVIRFEGDTSQLVKSNSIIDEPFLSIFEKIRERPEFVGVTDYLLYSVVVKQLELEKEVILSNFIGKYYKDSLQDLIKNPTDVALVTQKKSTDEFVYIQKGPYLGVEDLRVRNALPEFTSLENFELLGEMAEIKIFRKTNKMNFSLFKGVMTEYTQIIGSLWD